MTVIVISHTPDWPPLQIPSVEGFGGNNAPRRLTESRGYNPHCRRSSPKIVWRIDMAKDFPIPFCVPEN